MTRSTPSDATSQRTNNTAANGKASRSNQFSSSPTSAAAAAAAAAGAARQHHVNPNGSMAVYAPGFKYVLNLPRDAIVHLPPASLNVTRLVLCSNYDPRDPKGSCSMGERCKFVHADTGRAREHNIHVNYAWRSLDEVSYERFEAGTDFHVAPPNTKVPSDVMDSGLVLKTKALESTRRPLSHCAHYYFNRTCNLGSECHFIHAVFVDPTAKQHQRAPVPSQLGEGRELQLSKRQKEAHDEAIALAAAQHNQHHHHHAASAAQYNNNFAVAPQQQQQPMHFRQQQQQPMQQTPMKLHLPCGLSHAALQNCSSVTRTHQLPLRSSQSFEFETTPSSAVVGGSSPNSSVNSARGIRSLGSSSSSGGARFRHHPYDLNASRVITVACHC